MAAQAAATTQANRSRDFLRVATGTGTPACEPAWSPDGGTIYYRGADNRFYGAEVETSGPDLNVSSPVAFFDDPFVRRSFGGQWDVAPDGSFVFLGSDEVADELEALPILVFNWFEELRRLVPLEK